MKVAVLGPEGTYTTQAARSFYPEAELTFASSNSEAIEMVAAAECQAGVVPWENSTEGPVFASWESLFEHDLLVVDELYMDIHHMLYAMKSRKSDQPIEEIYSHPQALAQSRGYLRRHYPKTPTHETNSTVAGIERVASNKLTDALAIGPSGAGEAYGLVVVDENIEDKEGNQTQFMAFKKQPRTHKELDFTLAALVPEANDIGLMNSITGIVLDAEVDMSALHSRTLGGKMRNYMFYVRMEIPSSDPRYDQIADGLEEIGVKTIRMSA